MNNWKRVAVVAVAIFGSLLAFIVLVGPGIVRDRAVQWVADHTERTLSIERIRVNPLTLSIEIHGLALTDPDTLPFVAFDRLRLKLSARPLLERALIVKDLRLERPSVRLVRIETGHLSTALEISYQVIRDAGPQVALTGEVTLTGLKLNERSGAPLCFLPLGRVNLAGSKPFSDRITLEEIIIYGLEVTLNRDRQGGWNYERLTTGTGVSSPFPAGSEEKEAGNAPRITIDRTRLRAGRLHFRDELPDGGFATELKEISFDLQDFDTGAGKSNSFSLALESERGETIAITGSFALQPLAAAVKVDAAGIPLEPYFPSLAAVLTRSPTGTLSAGAEAELGEDGTVRLKNGVVTLRDLSLPFGGEDGLRLARLVVGGIAVYSGERRAEVATVEVENGELRFSRDAEGALSPSPCCGRLRQPTSRRQRRKRNHFPGGSAASPPPASTSPSPTGCFRNGRFSSCAASLSTSPDCILPVRPSTRLRRTAPLASAGCSTSPAGSACGASP